MKLLFGCHSYLFLAAGAAAVITNVSGSRQLNLESGLSHQSLSNSDLSTPAVLHRKTAASDFDRFNELFQGASITIPDDFEVSERVAFMDLTLFVENIRCYNISVGDMDVGHKKSNTNVNVTVDISALELNCDVDYHYEYGLLHGTGVAQVFTTNNSASTTLSFTSDDYATLPPSSSGVVQCTTDIQINNIDFHDDLASNFVELFEKWIKDLVEGKIEAVACSELGSLGTTFLQDMVNIADTTLQGYQNQNLGEEITNPLYLEQSASLPTDLVALNLQDKDTFIGGLFDKVLQLIDSNLGVVVPDPEGPLDSDLGINVMLRSTFLDEDRALVVNVDKLGMNAVVFQGHDVLTESSIKINQVKIFGLDSLTRFNPLNPIGKHTLQNQLTWKSLSLEFDVSVDIKPSSLEDAVLQDSTSSGITERIKIDFGVQGVDVNASIYVVIDEEALEGMELGSLLTKDNLLPCFMSVIHDFQLSGLAVDHQTIEIPTLNGFVSTGLDRVIAGAVNAAFDMYRGALESTMPSIFQTTVRKFVNEQIIAPLLNEEEKPFSCPTLSDDADGFVDFQDFFTSPDLAQEQKYGNVPSMLRNLLDSELLSLDSRTGRPKINNVLIEPLTLRQSGIEGSLVFDGNLFETGKTISVGGLNADIQLMASDAKIENLNTVTVPLALLEPAADEPFYLNNTVTVGQERPLRFSTRFLFAIAGDDENEIKNDLDITLDLDSAYINLIAMLKVANSRLLGFPLKDVFDLNCWMATIPAPDLDSTGIRTIESEVTAALAEIAATVSEVKLNVSCIECTSPGMFDLVELLSTKEAQEGASDVAKSLLKSASQFLSGNFMQVKIDRLLVEAARKCPHSPDFDPNSTPLQYQQLESIQNDSDTTFLELLGAVTVGLLAVVGLLVFSIRCIVRRRHRRWLSNLPAEQVKCLERQQRKEDGLEKEMNSSTKSMFQSMDVPSIVRWGMPVVILGNIGLFLSGHLSPGATVKIVATFAGQTIQVDNFFEFSVAKSTIDIWNAGGKELAVLILIFSGIWPYTKQLITLALWFMPPSWVSISKRGSILLWLDWLAKWSIIDIFVLVVSIAAFRVSIQSPGVSFLPEGFYSIDLLVEPLWGLYANMIAQLVSQISSHFIIHYHRKIQSTAMESFKNHHNLRSHRTLSSLAQTSCDGKTLLRKQQFGRPHRGEDPKLIVREWVSYGVIFVGVSSIILVVTGCVFPSFSLDILGLIGVAVESGQEFDDATTYHSVFTVIKLLMDEARFLDTAADLIGLGSLSALFLLTVLVVPILQSAALLTQWFSPLNMSQRSKLSIIGEVLQAWQYAEVYLIAIFVASWQLGPVSEYMINSYCGSLGGFFAQMVYFGLLKEEDAQCFSVQSSIEEGAYILAAGAVLLALLNTFVTKAVTQYVREKSQLVERIEDDFSANPEDSLKEPEQQSPEEGSSPTPIRPVPVLFSDTFRWLLKGGSRLTASNRAFEAQFDIPMGANKDISIKDDAIDWRKRTVSFVTEEEEGSIGGDNTPGLTDIPLEEVKAVQLEDEESCIPLELESYDFVIPSNQGVERQSLNNRPDEGDVGVSTSR